MSGPAFRYKRERICRHEGLAGLRMARIPITPLPSETALADPREIAQYSLSELAYFLDLRKPTLHAWRRPSKLNGKRIDPLITPADQVNALYSFYNLTEAHLLSMTTKFHRVKIVDVRRAMQHLRDQSILDLPHPLLSSEFLTDGRHTWLKQLERRVDLSQFGQLGLAPILDSYLERIERDEAFRPKKLFPLKQTGRVVSIAPSVSSGRPIIEGTGIPVATIWNRFKAGDPIEYLADDFDISADQVNGAIGYIEHLSAA